MSVFLTRDLKERAGAILDAAKTEPQFVFRDGQIYMISPVEPENRVPVRPEGFFADAYEKVAPERKALEAAFAGLPQSPQR